MSNDNTELLYRRTFVVQATPEHAFEEWTNAIGGWWPNDHSRDGDLIRVGYEPEVGGTWYDLSADDKRVERGTIQVWDPPHRLVVEWPLLEGEELATHGPSEVELRFTPHLESSTHVDLEHRHMERTFDVELMRSAFFSPYGWDLVVLNFQAFLASEPWPAGGRSRAQA